MTTNPSDFYSEFRKSIKLAQANVEQESSQTSGNDYLTVSDWDVNYNYEYGYLYAWCTVDVKDPANTITWITNSIWSTDQQTSYCDSVVQQNLQHLMSLASTDLYDPWTQGKKVLGLVAGWIEVNGTSLSFGFSKTFELDSSDE